MQIAFGIAGTLLGLYLFLWYRTVVALPVAVRPDFVRSAMFKWCVPALGSLLFASGVLALSAAGLWLGGSALAASVLAGWLIMRFDRYSAELRLIHERYRRLREANPAMEEFEVLFHLAEWRYPGWSQDRLVEMAAGKDIEGLMLLMMIRENGINPLSDWELYRSLKARAARIAGRGT
jgi:hypothetical protein